MAIPSNQLETWSKYESAATKSAKQTREKIENTLRTKNSVLSEKDIGFNVILQGSYKNDTIIRGSSDVDILVILEDSYGADLSELSSSEKERWRRNSGEVEYSWKNFRSDVLKELRSTYGRSSIEEGDKAIELETGSLPLGADVVVCRNHRKYWSYQNSSGQYAEGIEFWTLNNSKIVNFPEQHYVKGVEKHSDTDKKYKSTIRIFKNARNKLVEEDMISKEEAPSYFIECLLYNLDSSNYVWDKQERFKNILEHLEKDSISGYECQNELLELFGSESTQWSTRKANKFIKNLRRLWEDW